MVWKVCHGIETCEDCKNIFFQFIDSLMQENPMSLRFNRLLKLCQKNIDPKYSAPRLQRHLLGLEGTFIKRTRKAKQEVVYSVILPEEILDFTRFKLQETNEMLHQLPINRLVDLILRLYKITALYQLTADMDSLLYNITPEEYSRRMVFVRMFLRLKMNQYSEGFKNRSNNEYAEMLKCLKNETNHTLRTFLR